MTFFKPFKHGYILQIKLTPGAARCAVGGCIGDAKGEEYLKISVNAVPEKGKANKELLQWLSKKLKTPKKCFTIISGETDHFKRIYMETEASVEKENLINNLAREFAE